MKRRAALLLGLWVAACQAPYDRADEAIRREFPHVRINKIGDFHPAYGDYADIALRNALEAAVAASVPADALREATVAPVTQIVAAPLPGPLGYPTYYDIWVSVEGCASALYMKAGSTGRVFALHDKAGCLGRRED